MKQTYLQKADTSTKYLSRENGGPITYVQKADTSSTYWQYDRPTANLYLWDEPLNYLDIENQGQIIELIKKNSPTMLIIEHDRQFMDTLLESQIALKRNNNQK